jgi:hypothetical protein
VLVTPWTLAFWKLSAPNIASPPRCPLREMGQTGGRPCSMPLVSNGSGHPPLALAGGKPARPAPRRRPRNLHSFRPSQPHAGLRPPALHKHIWCGLSSLGCRLASRKPWWKRNGRGCVSRRPVARPRLPSCSAQPKALPTAVDVSHQGDELPTAFVTGRSGGRGEDSGRCGEDGVGDGKERG